MPGSGGTRAIRRLVLFGASGDLASRYLLPALARLHREGKLPAGFQIVGVARRDWDTGAFRRRVAELLDREAADVDPADRDALTSMLRYARADVTDMGAVAAAVDPTAGPIVAHLALPPAAFRPTIETLGALGLPEGSRIVIEKPFGEDLASARALNRLLQRTVPERAVFRIDHFLGKQTVQNVLGLRFANRVFEPIWNRQHVERVEIVWDESRAVEGRAGYYDRAGALRDMIQNHLLQLLCLVGMEPPATLDERDLRDRKVDVLRAVRRLSPEEVGRWTVRGRYSAGRANGRAIPAYVDEAGVDPERGTETFARVILTVENWRWSGVPFSLRSGKALARERREIAIRFRPVPHLAFGQGADPRPNVLHLRVDPDGLVLGLNVNAAGDPFDLEPLDLAAALAPPDLYAYGRLLLDVLEGDPTLFVRGDEAEEAWRIVEPILAGWAAGRAPLHEYPAGSDGPVTPDGPVAPWPG